MALEHKDLAVGKQAAQVIVGPAIAEAEFENRPAQTLDQRRRRVEQIALRLHAPNEAVEPAHGRD